MKKIHLIAVCLAFAALGSCVPVFATDTGPPIPKNEIVAQGNSVNTFDFTLTAPEMYSNLDYAFCESDATPLVYANCVTQSTQKAEADYSITIWDVGWCSKAAGVVNYGLKWKHTSTGICRIRYLSMPHRIS